MEKRDSSYDELMLKKVVDEANRLNDETGGDVSVSFVSDDGVKISVDIRKPKEEKLE